MEGRVLGKGEFVPGPVAKNLEGVAGVGLVGNGGVDILEGSFAPVVMAVLGKEVQDPVGIRGTAAQHEGGLVFHQRAFQVETAGEKPQTQGAGELLGVSFTRSDVQHGRDAAAVFGRDGALVQFGLRDKVCVKGRQDAEHVVGIEDRSVVVEDEVLVHRAAAHVEA